MHRSKTGLFYGVRQMLPVGTNSSKSRLTPGGLTLKAGVNQSKQQLRRLLPVATPTQRRGFESEQDDPGTVLSWYDCSAHSATSDKTERQSFAGTGLMLSSCHFRLILTFHPAEFLRALAMGRCMPCSSARPEKLDCH